MTSNCHLDANFKNVRSDRLVSNRVGTTLLQVKRIEVLGKNFNPSPPPNSVLAIDKSGNAYFKSIPNELQLLTRNGNFELSVKNSQSAIKIPINTRDGLLRLNASGKIPKEMIDIEADDVTFTLGGNEPKVQSVQNAISDLREMVLLSVGCTGSEYACRGPTGDAGPNGPTGGMGPTGSSANVHELIVDVLTLAETNEAIKESLLNMQLQLNESNKTVSLLQETVSQLQSIVFTLTSRN